MRESGNPRRQVLLMKTDVIRLLSFVCILSALALPALSADKTPAPNLQLESIADILKAAKTEADPGSSLDQADKQLAKELKKTPRSEKDKTVWGYLSKAAKAVEDAKGLLQGDKTDKTALGEKIDSAHEFVKLAILAKQSK